MKRLFIATAALTLLLTACGAENGEESANDVQAQEASAENVWDKYTFMFEDAILHDVAYQITSTEIAQSMGGYTSEGGVYVAVQIQVTNNSKKAIDLSNSDFQLYSSENDSFYEHDATVTAYHDEGFTFEKVNPGMSLTASVVYEVPQIVADSPAMLQIQPNQFSDEMAHIVIGERP